MLRAISCSPRVSILYRMLASHILLSHSPAEFIRAMANFDLSPIPPPHIQQNTDTVETGYMQPLGSQRLEQRVRRI